MESQQNTIVKKKKYKWLIVSSSSLLLIAVPYLIGSSYFSDKFFIGTSINGVTATGKDMSEVNKLLLSNSKGYKLEIIGKDGINDVIVPNSIDLKYNFKNDIENIKDKQNEFLWVQSVFTKEDYSLETSALYNEEKLDSTIDNLKFFTSENIVEPKDASLKFEKDAYTIVPEVVGNSIDKDLLKETIKECIAKGETTLDITKGNFYKKPLYTIESKEVVEAKTLLTKYVNTKINYKIGEASEVIDSSIINKWLNVDKNCRVSINENEILKYVDSLGEKYNTDNIKLDYSLNNTEVANVTITTDTSSINRENEAKKLIDFIKAGGEVTDELQFIAETNTETKNTFVDVNLKKQTIKYYVNGNILVQGNIVTGDESKGYSTPTGIFTLQYKLRNTVLRGPGYAVPVEYWMPFNGDIGLHDASWRSTFGGSIYLNNGSHGCVNIPHNVVETIYNNITPGTVVICR